MKVEDLSRTTKRRMEFLTKWAYRFAIVFLSACTLLGITALLAHLPPPLGHMTAMIMAMISPLLLVLIGYVIIRLEKNTHGKNH